MVVNADGASAGNLPENLEPRRQELIRIREAPLPTQPETHFSLTLVLQHCFGWPAGAACQGKGLGDDLQVSST